jgi:3',5'-cyclic AMP phosphodiesterase CpdA
VYNTQYHTPESKIKMYEPQFYEPYGNYPGKILAIPGNHDSNPEEDPKSIDAFQQNFCADPPSAAALTAALQTLKRSPIYQPGVYYRLDAPFVQILALFSNGGELEGVVRGGSAGNDQWNFLVDQLKDIKAARTGNPTQRRALLMAVHHPPFSGGGGHSGSSSMLEDLDAAFHKGGVYPDAILSGHSHVYERFTRQATVGKKTMEVPYVVAGNGGHGITPMKTKHDRKPIQTPLPSKPTRGENEASGDHILQQYFNGFGHLVITVTPRVLTIDLIGTRTETSTPVDSVTVQLAENFVDNRIISQTPAFDHPATGEQQPAHTRKALA